MAKKRKQTKQVEKDDSITKPPKKLLVKCDRILQFDATADADEIINRYAAASELRDILENEGRDYGDAAVKTLADLLSWSHEKVRQYDRVAERYDSDKIDEIIELTDENNSQFSWSHLVVIAGVDDGRVRNGLLAKSLKAKLPVRDLKKLAAEAKGKDKGRPSLPTAAVAVRTLISDADKLIDHSKTLAGNLPKILKGKKGVAITQKLRDSLETAIEKQMLASEVCTENVTRLEQCLAGIDGTVKPKAAKRKASPKKKTPTRGGKGKSRSMKKKQKVAA